MHRRAVIITNHNPLFTSYTIDILIINKRVRSLRENLTIQKGTEKNPQTERAMGKISFNGLSSVLTLI